MRTLVLGLLVLSLGCGGGQSAQPATSTPKPEGSATTTTTAATDDDDGITPEVKAAVVAARPATPSTNTDGSILLDQLVKPGSTAADFPKASAKDEDCTKGLGFRGDSATDYATLTGKCGAPTGLKEYVKTVTGKFDATHTHDTYTFKMLGGFCYRFFAVGDSSVKTIDIRVQRPEGALISVATSKNFIAVMNPDGVWCKTHDREFRLVVETGGGQGNYTFGVWARPKP